MNWLLRDLRYALRESLRRPGFSLLAVLTLALGIGSVATMFSVIQNVLLNPFPYAQPRRMVDVIIQDKARAQGGRRWALTIPEFRAYVDESNVFEEAVGTATSEMTYHRSDGAELFTVAAVTPNTFHFLGVPPLLGRAITSVDAKPGAPLVGVLSNRIWMSRFGGDPRILGQHIILDDKTVEVTGVMPPHFDWNNADVWIPDPVSLSDSSGNQKRFALQARLKRGVSLSQAMAQLQVIGERLAGAHPDLYPKNFAVTVLTVVDWVVGRFRLVLYTLFSAVSLLLLIACCNVANMLLARATAREREIAIRSALGGTRFQILRQLLVESLVLALGGGLLGVILAYGATFALRILVPPYTIARETVIVMDVPVLLFALGVAMLTAIFFGAAPALHSTRRDVSSGLASSGKGAGGSIGRGGLRNSLVVSEVALSLVLLAGAGILIRGFIQMTGADLGFNPHNLIVASVGLTNSPRKHRVEFIQEVAAKIAALPGVVNVAEVGGLPPYGGENTVIDVQGKVHGEIWRGEVEFCGASYFQTVGFRFLRGIPLSESDIAERRKIAVVNETLARRFFGDNDPLGARIHLDALARGTTISDPTFEIVGVVADIRNEGPQEPAAPEAFVPVTIEDAWYPRILVRTAGDPQALFSAVRRTIHTVDPNAVEFGDLTSLDDFIRSASYAQPRFSVALLGIFAAIGLVLVGTGVYGVMAYVVSSQTRDIGIRMALGAGRGEVFRGVLSASLRLIGLGVLAGTAASFATNRMISRQVWTVDAFDPMTLGGGIAVIVILGLAACAVPALRATRVSPMEALRSE